MRESEVTSLIGTPLLMTTQLWEEAWVYFDPSLAPTNAIDEHGTSVYANVFEKLSTLRFSQEGVVITNYGEYLQSDLHGLTKEQVVSRVGQL